MAVHVLPVLLVLAVGHMQVLFLQAHLQEQEQQLQALLLLC